MTRIGIFWPNVDAIDRWVKERGCNVLIYPNGSISGHADDWERMHERVELLWGEGYIDLRVIRPPAYALGSKPHSLDSRYRKHLLAFALPDEPEDKAKGPDGKRLDYNKEPAAVAEYAVKLARAYKAYASDIPVFVTFNGLHLQGTVKAPVKKMYEDIADECGILSADAYNGTQRQIRHADGSLRYDLSGHWECTDQLRQWTSKPAWGVIDTSDQKLHANNEDAEKATGKPGAVWLASRAPTRDEAEELVTHFPDGWFYFPQALKNYGDKNMNINDGTTPDLAAWMPQIAARKNPQQPPSPGDDRKRLEAWEAWYRRGQELVR